MTPATNKIEVPPLEELAKGSFKDIQRHIPILSLPELLIVGARPLDKYPRERAELGYFNRAAKEKLRALEKERGNILAAIIGALYPEEQLERHAVSSYLGKTELLISEQALPPKIFDGLGNDIKKEVSRYRNSIRAFNEGSRHTPGNITELAHLQHTFVNLTFLLHPEYSKRNPHLISVKTKEYSRIAGKIPYYIIDEYRDREGIRKTECVKDLKRRLSLEDGIIRDIAGLQFVTLSMEELVRIKEYLFKSNDVEVLVDAHGKKRVDDYYVERKGPYHAIHMDVVWNPSSGARLFKPADSVEIILMELPYFISSNFGPESYWRRINAQEMGIVEKNLKYGRLQISPFTPAERQWRDAVKGRIMSILNYCDTSPPKR